MIRLRRRGWIGLAVTIPLAAVSLTASAVPAPGSTPAFTTTETITRTHLVNGLDDQVDTRTVTVTVSETQDLRDRQGITVAWSGAHPTGGLVTDQNSAAAAQEEYPVVVMECRGVDDRNAPAAKQLSPETCWTQTPGERFMYSQNDSIYPPYRMDRYASTADRALTVNQPDPLPSACSDLVGAHWIPFVAADGTVYPGGNLGCAGMAPEAANSADSLQPGNTTYGVADPQGNGSTKFVVQTADTNASLGCSMTVACSLVIIPIMGISCDAAGTAGDPPNLGLPPSDRPSASLVPKVFAACSQTGHFPPGVFNAGTDSPDLAVSGQLWWSASNWRNRISVPLTFAHSAGVCNIVNNNATAYVYGSESMLQATQQWAPHFCLTKGLFSLQHVQTSEVQAKNLLSIGNVEAAFEGEPPETPFPARTVQAPAALSGFAIAFSADDANGEPYHDLRLNARLLAKLLTESYQSCALNCLNFPQLKNNPIDITRDPEFQALNPDIPPSSYLEAASTLAVMSSDSDVMTALTSYINADPEARAWLNGQPDPWGMIVNPAYWRIKLPVSSWPLLDTHIRQFTGGANHCLDLDPVPWLPLVASPVSNPATIALDMQFDISNSQVVCKNNGAQDQKLTAVGREAAGSRFLVGLVSLADAERYQLNTAQLQTQNTNVGSAEFTDASGRTFVGPTDASLKAAAAMLRPDDTKQTWLLPYDAMRTTKPGLHAYPGTMLLSVDVPTEGLAKADAHRYEQLLQFIAGPGQKAGLGDGQLPPGYLPLTAANGLGGLAAYTLRSARSVGEQMGELPLPSGKVLPGHTSSPPASGGASPPGGQPPSTPGGEQATGSPGPGSGPGPGAESSAPTSAVRSPGSSASPTSGSSTPAAALVGKTTDTKSGVLGLALPALAIAALACALLSAWFGGAVRRR